MRNLFLSFENAKEVCKERKILTKVDYQNRYKAIHPQLPSNPYRFNKDCGWVNWGEFLGVDNRRGACLSYRQAQKVCVENQIMSQLDYRNRYKDIHPKIPSTPDVFYKNSGWTNWGEFLATGNGCKVFLEFDVAKKLCKQHNIFSQSDYKKRFKDIHPQFPSNPNSTYRDKWNGWRDFLGVDNQKTSFPEIRIKSELDYIFQQESYKLKGKFGISEIDIYYPNLKLGIEYDGCFWHQNKVKEDTNKYLLAKANNITLINIREQYKQLKLPIINPDFDIVHPYGQDLLPTIKSLLVTASAWLDFDPVIQARISDYLKVDSFQNEQQFIALFQMSCLSFDQAKKVCRQHNVSGFYDYNKRYKSIDPRLPSNPHVVYKDKGWTNMSDFLGTTKTFLSYHQAQKICLSSGVLSGPDYYKRYKAIHPDLPSSPNVTYKDSGWNGWREFLKTTRSQKTFPKLESAKIACKQHNIVTQLDYRNRYKDIHPQLPSRPDIIYKDVGWNGWREFLSKKKPTTPDNSNYRA